MLELEPPQKSGCETTLRGTITWTPTYADLGKHTFKFIASTERDKVEVVQVTEVVEEFRSFMMPGLQYSVYLPKATTGTGGFKARRRSSCSTRGCTATRTTARATCASTPISISSYP